jgi:aryl-alcohol dehydrogenase-like predicted oxidoreductase
MQYKTFGNTGLLVSTLCLGTMTLRAMPKRAIQPEKRWRNPEP